jgi:hypothetical protein
MVLQIRDKSLKEQKHQTGWGRGKRDTLQHFLARNNPWMTCTHSSSLKHQCCIKFCNVKHMRKYIKTMMMCLDVRVMLSYIWIQNHATLTKVHWLHILRVWLALKH